MKALVLYSGGLDSRLCIKIMQELGFNVTALYFELPFGCNCSTKENRLFVEKQNAEFRIINVTQKQMLPKYLNAIKNAKFGYGKGFNPCADCKVWMFKEAKKIFDKEKFDVFVSGEVLNQRPMSQTENKRRQIDKELGFDILRPLSAKQLPETIYEKNGIVNREKLYDINGRRRIIQMELAKKYKIEYPTPAGGCLLCEKAFKKRFEYLIKNNIINEKKINLIKIGRHFIINGIWFIVARNESEGEQICQYKNHFLMGDKGIPTVYFSKKDENAKKLQDAFKSNLTKDRNIFDEFKL